MGDEAVSPINHISEVEDFDEELLNDLKAALEPFSLEDPMITIYTVPDPIRNVDSDAYGSRYMTLAVDTTYDLDLIRGDETVRSHALRHLHSILTRNPALSLNDYLLAMNELKDQIKSCHYIDITIDFQRLVWVVINSCFIVDVLLMFYEGRLTASVDSTCASIYFQYMWIDFLLVENQQPFFVLEKVFDLAVVDKSKYPSLVDIALFFFDHFVERDLQKPVMESKSIHHLLHLVHHQLLPSDPLQSFNLKLQPSRKLFFNKVKDAIPLHHSPPPPLLESSQTKQLFITKPIPSAKRLEEVGIKFKKRDGTGFLNVCFDNRKGVLEIPRLYVHSNTKILLRNLIAWEQCHPAAGAYFTGYAIFMDYIVNTDKDIEILVQSGIIEHSLGTDDDVAAVFNGLSTNLVHTGLEDEFLPYICKELNKYCHNHYNIWWAKLMADYFSNPWTTISIGAAIILLILTFTQTFFSAYSYFRPP
ncbi:UPF0481 protein At3g47200-like [Aristolochia californica]|uniref:UPF0481 protein At3g47200-like n=1 Tax=Aristolochia californica TaxID=171875 RepID=UPI0035D5BDE8